MQCGLKSQLAYVMEYGSTPYYRDGMGKNGRRIVRVQNDTFKTLP